MACLQAIVWIDEHEACIHRMDKGLELESRILADDESRPGREVNTVKMDVELPSVAQSKYFERVARALDVADEILIVGPSATKTEFVAFMHKNQHALDPRILGVETIANRTDVELSGFAKLYFASTRPTRPGNGTGRTEAE